MKKRVVTGVSPIDAQHHKQKPPLLGGIQLQADVYIRRPPTVCYAYWRDFSHLPDFMTHIESVTVEDEQRSHWVVAGPADTSVEWDAEIIADVPNERISWRSVENAQVDNAGSVEFASEEGGRATDVKVALTYNPAMGVVGDVLSKLFGESPDQELAEDLEHFKEIVEESK